MSINMLSFKITMALSLLGTGLQTADVTKKKLITTLQTIIQQKHSPVILTAPPQATLTKVIELTQTVGDSICALRVNPEEIYGYSDEKIYKIARSLNILLLRRDNDFVYTLIDPEENNVIAKIRISKNANKTKELKANIDQNNDTLGYLAPKPIAPGRKDLINMIFGISLDQSFNTKYTTPESAFEDGANCIVVGSGIYNAKDHKHAAKTYQDRAWKALQKAKNSSLGCSN